MVSYVRGDFIFVSLIVCYIAVRSSLEGNWVLDTYYV